MLLRGFLCVWDDVFLCRREEFQVKLLSIEESIGERFYPFARIYVSALRAHLNVEGQVTVAKYKVMERLLFEHFTAKYYQPFLFFAQKDLVFMAICHPAFSRKIQGQRCAEARMQPGKKLLRNAAGKYFLQEFVAVVGGTQAVAMGNIKKFTPDFALLGATVHNHSKFFLKIAENPHVVIAGEVVYRNARIANLCDFPQQSYKSFGNNRFVFKPEVENISQQVNLIGILTHLLQPADQ